MNKKDLENRLVNFAPLIIKVVENTPSSKAGNTLANQIVRSGTSVALNYGEAQSAESQRDFIHKMKVVLKELRETHVCLKIIYTSSLFEKEELILQAKKENNELIAIFVKSVLTASKTAQ